MHSIHDVQDVYPNSPAAAAGLHSFDDFIIGTDSSANEVCTNMNMWPILLLGVNKVQNLARRNII